MTTPSQILRGQTGALTAYARRNAGAFNAYQTVHLVHELARAAPARPMRTRSQFNAAGFPDSADEEFKSRVAMLRKNIAQLLADTDANLVAAPVFAVGTGEGPDRPARITLQADTVALQARYEQWATEGVTAGQVFAHFGVVDYGGDQNAFEAEYNALLGRALALNVPTTATPPPAPHTTASDIAKQLLPQSLTTTLLWATGIIVAGLVTYGVITSRRR